MIAFPAIDLREGACVQLVGGSYDDERVRLPDPLAVSRRWAELGLRQQHLVDLDAATGRGSNLTLIKRLLAQPGLTCQVGGGVRSEERIRELAEAGAARIIVGTRAIEEPAWLEQMAQAFPDRLVVAADVRERLVVTRGWANTSSRDIGEVVDALSALPLAGILVTAVHKEGQLGGTDLALMSEVVARSKVPVQASGGITTLEDLRALASRGVAGAVIGMALYTGKLDAGELAKEFC